MKSDLDDLMQAADLDALLVIGGSIQNPAMYYFTGGIHLLRGVLVKRRGHAPVLFHPTMERDEAARSGLAVRDLIDFSWNGSLSLDGGERLAQVLTSLDVRGRVAVYGRLAVGPLLACLPVLRPRRPEIDIATDPIPVRPGAHYMIGGVTVDQEGRTTLPGLWAAGEVTSHSHTCAGRLAK